MAHCKLIDKTTSTIKSVQTLSTFIWQVVKASEENDFQQKNKSH